MANCSSCQHFVGTNARSCPNCGEVFSEWEVKYNQQQATEEVIERLKKEELAKEKEEEMTPQEAQALGCLALLVLVGLGIFFLYKKYIA